MQLRAGARNSVSIPRIESTLERIQGWDERVCLRMNRAMRLRPLLAMLRCVSRLGDGVFWYALMLALLLASDSAVPAVLHMVAVGLSCTLTYKLFKQGTMRPRPFQVNARIAAGASPLDQFSFPSGHTLHAVAFTLVACAHFPWLATLLVPFTLLVAASRVVLGLHYPSDVAAGAVLGASIAALSFLI